MLLPRDGNRIKRGIALKNTRPLFKKTKGGRWEPFYYYIGLGGGEIPVRGRSSTRM